MRLQVAKWGNSLALRIPADYARSAGLKEGDNVDARLTPVGGLSIRPTKWDRKAFAREVAAVRDAQPMGTSVIEELRQRIGG